MSGCGGRTRWTGRQIVEGYAPRLWLGEALATVRRILLIVGTARTERALHPGHGRLLQRRRLLVHPSTSFANPAMTVGRAFTGTSAGMGPQRDGDVENRDPAAGLVWETEAIA